MRRVATAGVVVALAPLLVTLGSWVYRAWGTETAAHAAIGWAFVVALAVAALHMIWEPQ